MEERPLTEQESLSLIQQMIQTAKAEQKDDGKEWIVWGWVLFAASILTFLNLQSHWFGTYFFWNLFGLFTIGFFLYRVVTRFFFKKPQRVKTYTAAIFEKLNAGYFIFLFFIIFAINLGVGPAKGFALLIALYAFWVLIHGTVLNFKPSIVAAFVMWGIGFVCLYLQNLQWIMLLHGLAVLIGYIIPGHIANREFNKIKSGESYRSV
jgi:hypothetical protein